MTKMTAAASQSYTVEHPEFLAAAPVRQPSAPVAGEAAPAAPPSPDASRVRRAQTAPFNPTDAIANLFSRQDRADRNTPNGPVVASDFAQRARSVFTRIDGDRDGHITESEVNRALHDASFTGRDAAVVAALYDRVGDLEELADDEYGDENDGVTMADLDAFQRLGTTSSLRRGVEGRYGAAPSQVAATSTQLFPRGMASITAAAVNQGGVGDCYFLAALAGLADRNPAAIQRMIRDNGNGTYTVSFPGRTPVTVARPTEAEIGLGASGYAQGMWVTVMEKAYARLRDSGMDYQEIDGGTVDEGIEALTGKSTTTWNTSFNSNESIRREIATALSEGRVVTANIRPEFLDDLFGADAPRREGMPTRHVYTIMGVDPRTNEIIVRNPWGTGGPAGDGIHRFSQDQFGSLFRTVAFQDR